MSMPRFNKLVDVFSGRNSYWAYIKAKLGSASPETQGNIKDLYELLEAYYYNNAAYEMIAQLGGPAVTPESLAALRTPALRAVEFYVTTLWPGNLPGALPLQTENDRIEDPIQQIWKWSNWAQNKQLAVRWYALYGDLFLKAARRDSFPQPAETGAIQADLIQPRSVFIDIVNPKYVADRDFEIDQRGVIQRIRLDIPKVRRAGGQLDSYTYTEVWTLRGLTVFEHKKGPETPADQLGEPIVGVALEDMGIDFIPIVYAPFKTIDKAGRGVGAFTLALDKIDELNRMATRLHSLLFRYNQPIWALSANLVDAHGRPMPAPAIDEGAGAIVEIGEERYIGLPGNSSMEAMIPQLNYGEYLATIEAQAAELERDLPETIFSRLRDKNLSGKAIELLLGDAIGRAIEARGNAEAALARVNAMCLTLGRLAGLFDKGIGTYENGDFEHSFLERPIIAMPEADRAQVVKEYVGAGLALRTALERAHFTPDQIDQALEDKEAEAGRQQANFAASLLEAQAAMDRGEQDNGLTQPVITEEAASAQ